MYARAGSPEWASGACLLLRRSALERLDGLDEDFFLYCEDLDLCRRLRDAGYDIRYEPAAVAVHEGGQSSPRSALLPVLAASRVRYARLHQPPVVALLERLGVAVGALTHAVVSRGGLAARRGWLRAGVRALGPARPSGPQ
jgi:N-acetylglucosaminyl-diphospho-decaprenol L-rhamnosyltransferase